MKLFVVFTIFLSIVLADPTKDAILQRIAIADRSLLSASRNFTYHGLDYFAEIVNRTLDTVVRLQHMTEIIDGKSLDDNEELSNIDLNLVLIEKEIPRLTTNPDPRESMKAGGLYLGYILGSINLITDTKPRPEEEKLKNQVVAIILQEQIIAEFGLESKSERQKATKKLDTLYQELGNVLNDTRLPTMQKMFTLEAAANEAIKKYNKLGDRETSSHISHGLIEFLDRSIELARWLPIQDRVIAGMFLATVQKHYVAYCELHAWVFDPILTPRPLLEKIGDVVHKL